MTTSESSQAVSASPELQAVRAHAELLLNELRYNSLQNLLVSGVFAMFFSRLSEGSWLWGWWIIFVVVAAARTLVLRTLEASPIFGERRSLAIYGCIGATACMWGVAPLACRTAGVDMSFVVAISWVTVVVLGGANAFRDDMIATAVLAIPATLPSIIVLLFDARQGSFGRGFCAHARLRPPGCRLHSRPTRPRD